MDAKRKKELLGITRDIGMEVSRLEAEIYTDQVAQPELHTLRNALDDVRSAIAAQPET